MPSKSESIDHGSHAPVSVVVKCCLLDGAFITRMVPHMIRQAHYPFDERIVVLDPRTDFSGKYERRQPVSRKMMDSALRQLLVDGLVDRIEEVDYAREQVELHMSRYFGPDWGRATLHANSGGPIYASLYAMDIARNDTVLLMDCDILFYTNGDSWVQQALEVMDADPAVWMMMTHPGPPAGVAGNSLRGDHTRNARWDAGQGTWHFSHASSRYFLADRRRFHGRLPVLTGPMGYSKPLEQSLSAALEAAGASRGALGRLDSWHLHAHSHGYPFPEWLDALIDAVEHGRYPDLQAGNYDLRLDQPQSRGAWQEFLGKGRHLESNRRLKILFHEPNRTSPGELDAERGSSVYWHYTATLLSRDHDVDCVYSDQQIPGKHYDVVVFNRIDLVGYQQASLLLQSLNAGKVLLWEHYLPDRRKIDAFNGFYKNRWISGLIFVSRYHRRLYADAGLEKELMKGSLVHEGGVRSDMLPSSLKSEREPVFVYASVPHRGLSQFLAIWPRIHAQLPDFRLCVTGGTELYMGRKRQSLVAKMDRLLSQIGKLPGVDIAGLLPTTEFYELLGSSEALLYPAQGEELSCISLHEAMYLGCVPVVSSQGVFPSIIRDGGNGKLVEGVPRCYLDDPEDGPSESFRKRFADTVIHCVENGEFNAIRLQNRHDFTWESRVRDFKGHLESMVGT